MRCLLLAACLALGACANVPELDARIGPDVASAPYPDLLPLDQLLTGTPASEPEAERESLAARRAALEARAGALRGPVIDTPTRDRLSTAVQP
ncbi:hypothetical protein SAMN05421688_0232 [Poseidonocella pacifica]|uniref:Beta-barrel assembly machine subunit BamF n=1 Tax=Poseidonocella pacifica TaxID=871651 RepID=A0A1I0V3D9_9RHOB|nr:hypothetical protein [Poseidonocella pacifica]SFA70567.1 hypothetical protein SAMN05421688_0232 [Poseidonocella pacifica]